MVILGLWDGAESGAALVIGDHLAAVAHAHPLSRGIPWKEADGLLARAGLTPDAVDFVAVAGRYTPPFALRRHPEWRSMGSDPFAVARSMGTRWQSVLRRTGLGALEADRAAEWFEQQLKARGYAPRKVVLVDVHKALAAAAYRCQPDDGALVVVAQPRGDGALLTLHQGRAGQLDRIALQVGSSAEHLWLERCMAAAGIPDERTLFALAQAPAGHRLALGLEVDEHRIVARSTPLATRERGPWQVLRGLPLEVSAQAICGQLRERMLLWLHGWLQRLEGPKGARHGAAFQGQIAIGGSWGRDPRLIAAIAELPGVERVWAGPWLGMAALPVGAALYVGGTPPSLVEDGLASLPGRAHGAPGVGEEARLAGVSLRARDPLSLARALARGLSVARLGREELAGAVLARADQEQAIERARLALGRPTHEVPAIWASEEGLPVERGSALSGPLRYGTAAPRVVEDETKQLRGLPSPDGRWVVRHAHHPELLEMLRGLQSETGCSAVAAWPLGLGSDPAATCAADAVAIWRRSGLAALDLGQDGVGWAEGA